MYVGLGIFLLVVGAVLAFATSITVHGFDLSIVGWILMAGGLLAIILSFAVRPRRREVVEREVAPRTAVRETAPRTEVRDARVEPE
jgi:hypothetical protein